jgi:hypothetical protein
MGWDGMDWVHLAHVTQQWNFEVHKVLRNSLVAERLTASQVLSFMELVSQSPSQPINLSRTL